VTRDGVLFVLGVGGIVHEAFLRTGATRPELLMLFAAACGLPVALRKDEKRAADDAARPERDRPSERA
jgi:hypothetical protein